MSTPLPTSCARPWTAQDVPAVAALLERDVGRGLAWSWRPGKAIPGLAEPDVRVGEDHAGQLIATAAAFQHPCWVQGAPVDVPYLAGLRAAPPARRRLFADGYASLLGGRWGLSTIGRANQTARRLLERGLPGFPVYRPVAELISFALPVPARATSASGCEPGAIMDRLAARAASDLAHRWTRPGLAAACAHAVASAFSDTACGLVLDARAFRRCRVSLPPWQRAAGRLLGQRVPGPDRDLPLGLVAALAGSAADRAGLIEALRVSADGLDWLALTLDVRDPLVAALHRPFGTREWESTLYVVAPAGVAGPAAVESVTVEAAWL